jgi:thymidylate synthase (FAD)
VTVVRNSVRCDECDTEIESKSTHDYVVCPCGAVAVDGGPSYLKRSFQIGTPQYTETSICGPDLPKGGQLSLLSFHGGDLDVVNAARVSFKKESRDYKDEDDGVLRYLIQNKHGSPFEHGYFRFYVKAPIFVFREWHRHRAGWSYNEMSGRYTKLDREFYEPTELRQRIGKPGQYTYVRHPQPHGPTKEISDAMETAWHSYEHLLASGVAPEQARVVLPVGTMSQMWASCNPRSLMHFLSLRTHQTAQEEIRGYATSMELAFRRSMPRTWHWWNETGRIAP